MQSELNELFITKEADGTPRWLLVSSSAYRDRDGEIVTEKALQRAVARMDATGDYGDLRWWHTDVVLGKADYAAIHAHHLVESGTFVSPATAKAVAGQAGRLGGSIAFYPLAKERRDYGDILMVERSLLPRGRESNIYTALTVTGGTMDASKRAKLIELVGEAEATKMLKRLDDDAEAADKKGVERKEKGLGARLWDWLLGQPEMKEADGPAPEDEEEGEDDPAPEEKGADTSVTRKELAAVVATIRKEIATAGGLIEKAQGKFATKAEVAAVKAEADKTAGVVGKVEKGIAALIDEQPRIFGRGYRASEDDTTVNKAKTEEAAQEKAQAGGILAVVDRLDGKQ